MAGLSALVKNGLALRACPKRGRGVPAPPPGRTSALPSPGERALEFSCFRVLERAGQRALPLPASALRPEDSAHVLVGGLVLVACGAQHLHVAGLVAPAVTQWSDVVNLHSPRRERMAAGMAPCPASAVDRSSYCLPDAVACGTAMATPAAFAVGTTGDSYPGACHASALQHEHPRGLSWSLPSSVAAG